MAHVVPKARHDEAGVAPDVLLPTQYLDRVRPQNEFTGEQRLIIAVLEHAIDDYLKYAAATDRRRRRVFLNAERWVESADASPLYSFQTICDHLGLDAAYLRRGLRRCAARARREALRPAGVIEFVVPPERRRASNE
jgi:hypothetical protein